MVAESSRRNAMIKFARVIDNVAVDVSTDPSNCFHPDIAAQFVEVPDNVENGWIYDETAKTWSAPTPQPEPVPVVVYPIMNAMTFYLCFTALERIAIKTSKDLGVVEFWDTYQLAVATSSPVNPNLPSIQQAIGYLALTPTSEPIAGPGILKPERVQQILNGELQ